MARWRSFESIARDAPRLRISSGRPAPDGAAFATERFAPWTPASALHAGPDDLDNFRCGAAIAVIFDFLPAAVFRGGPQPVPAALDSLDPLRNIAQGDAGNAVEVRFLLHAAGIRHDDAGVVQQLAHVEISKRLRHNGAGIADVQAGARP